MQNSIAKFFVLFHVEKLGTGESLCVLGTGEGLTGCDGGFRTLRPEMRPTRVGRYFFPMTPGGLPTGHLVDPRN
jgi:hypothetical protein